MTQQTTWKGIEQKPLQIGDVVAIVWKNYPAREDHRGWIDHFNETGTMAYISPTLWEGNHLWVAIEKLRFVSRPTDPDYDPFKGTKEAGKWLDERVRA